MRPRPTHKFVVLGVAVVMASAAVGCSSNKEASGAAASTTISDPATTTAVVTTTIAATTEAPTTVPVATATFPTPTAAGAALFAAWTKSTRDGAGALGLAPSAELDKLFAARPLPAVKNRGCDDGDFGSASCFFGNGAGGVNVGLTPAAGGWSITSIDPFG